jgi:hypothetical protein
MPSRSTHSTPSSKVGCAAACLAFALACNTQREVEKQTQNLREAEANTGNITKRLEAELAEAKGEVARLENKVALARRGITDEVLSARKDLEQSLGEQQKRVEGEVKEAQSQAQQHNQDTQKAVQELERTQPPARVESEVVTQTEVTPQSRQVETVERQELIPVRGGPQKRTVTTTADAGSQVAPSSAPVRQETRPEQEPEQDPQQRQGQQQEQQERQQPMQP